MQGCHINGDVTDNRLENLYWGTPKQNAADTARHGTHRNAKKTHCVRDHELSGDNPYIRKNGTRLCRACKQIKEGERYDRLHPDKGHGRHKLSLEYREELVRLRKEQGITYQKLADMFGIDYKTAYKICNRQSE